MNTATEAMRALQHQYPLASMVRLLDRTHVVQGWVWDAFAGGACLVLTPEGYASGPVVLDARDLAHARRI